MSQHETYLGDGLFASWDGWQVKLRAPREGGDHVVFLEDGLTLEAFLEFLRCTPDKATRLKRSRRVRSAAFFIAAR